MAPQILTADEAAALVADGDAVAVCGVVWSIVPERLLEALERRFLDTGHPRDLTEHHLHIYGMGRGTGLERFAHEGMIDRIIGGSFAPPYWFKDAEINRMVREDALEVYLVPAGVICALWRETGGGRPGILSDIGLGTFVDPRQLGGMITERARRSGHRVNELMTVDGRDLIFYRAQPIDVSLVRATTADEDGNLSFEDEPTLQGVFAQILATRASGGKVVVQVKNIVKSGSIDPRLVRVPGVMVDALVEAPEQRIFEYDIHEDSPAFTGALRLPEPPVERVPFSADSIIARRAALEVEPGAFANLGAGIPVNTMTKVLRETGQDQTCTISVEHGSLGGANLGEFLCQTHWNPTSTMDAPTTFDYYTGGSLDVGFLGIAQADGAGNVNVSMVGDAMAGIGGFMDIAQGARKIVFCGTLTYGGLEVEVADGELRIVTEGRHRKFLKDVDLISFSGAYSVERGQEAMFVTERCVMALRPDGLELVEVAPGIDVERDVLAAVDCEVKVSDTLGTMPAAVLADGAQAATADLGRRVA